MPQFKIMLSKCWCPWHKSRRFRWLDGPPYRCLHITTVATSIVTGLPTWRPRSY